MPLKNLFDLQPINRITFFVSNIVLAGFSIGIAWYLQWAGFQNYINYSFALLLVMTMVVCFFCFKRAMDIHPKIVATSIIPLIAAFSDYKLLAYLGIGHFTSYNSILVPVIAVVDILYLIALAIIPGQQNSG